MSVTLKDVAQACGVSRQAVSLALNNTGRMTQETRERIVRVAAELGYRRSSVARMMRSRRFGSVGLLMSTRAGHGWVSETLLAALHDELARHDLHLIVVRLPDEELTETTIPRLLQEWACDGLLISYISGAPQRLIDLIELHHIPAVWMNTRREHDAVYPDDFCMARRLTNDLLAVGHRRIDYLADVMGSSNQDDEHYSVAERRTGYETAMREAGCEPRCIEYSPRQPNEDMTDLGTDWLSRPERPTAVLAYSSGSALVMTLAALQLGLRVPKDLSLVTFASPGENIVYTATSFIYLPWTEIARRAVDILVQKIENPSLLFPSCSEVSDLIEGRTIAPPASGI